MLLVPAFAAAGVAPERNEPSVTGDAAGSLLFGEAYPIEVHISFQAALFHWLDSLTGLLGPGMTSGKTTDAHRLDFQRVAGEPTAEQLGMLRQYADARRRIARRSRGGNELRLTRAVFEEPTLAAALERVGPLLEQQDVEIIRDAFAYFTPQYEKIWNDGRVARQFYDRVRRSPQRRAIGLFLARVAKFYGADPSRQGVPRLVLVPVRDGQGTHAQAVGPDLLIEIRSGDHLGDQVAPIVHENAHFLFYSMDPVRRRALRETATGLAPEGAHAWRVMLEALPTAIGQGVAGHTFRRAKWGLERGWYHREDVDRYAKAIFPLVQEALNGNAELDQAFLEKAVRVYAEAGIGRFSRRSP